MFGIIFGSLDRVVKTLQADRAYGMEISLRLFVISFVFATRTTFSNIPIDILLFNKIRDENDEGDFSDRREIMYRL